MLLVFCTGSLCCIMRTEMSCTSLSAGLGLASSQKWTNEETQNGCSKDRLQDNAHPYK